MSPEERQTMNRLCQRIQEEKDSHAFDKLVKELNDLLEVTRDNPARPHTEPERNSVRAGLGALAWDECLLFLAFEQVISSSIYSM